MALLARSLIAASLACALHAQYLSPETGQLASRQWVSDQIAAAGVPAGMIVFVASGSCPTGWTQVSSLGNYLLLTTAAAGDVGTTGGSTSYTPTGAVAAPTFTGSAGTVPAPTFTGNAGTVPAPTFTGNSATTSDVSAGTPAGTNSTSATTGNCAATNIAAGTGSTTACKATAPNLSVSKQTFTGSALGTHNHTVTAAGTNSTVSFTPAGTNSTVSFTPAGTNSAPAFTGNVATVQPPYLKVIPCSKN